MGTPETSITGRKASSPRCSLAWTKRQSRERGGTWHPAMDLLVRTGKTSSPRASPNVQEGRRFAGIKFCVRDGGNKLISGLLTLVWLHLLHTW